MNDSALIFDDVTFHYPSTDAGIDHFSVHLEPGARVALVGESGSGKTTAARLGLGLLPAQSGSVTFAGMPVRSRSRSIMRNFRSHVQAVFQDPYSSLNPRMRVGAIVAEPLHALKAASGARAREMVHEALRLVGVDPQRADEYPRTFSGGQRQRIAIARALVSEPSVIIADEPVSALDMATRASVMEMIDSITRERGMSLLLVSHDLATVASACDTIVVLKDGYVEDRGPTRRVLSAPEGDYARALIAAIPRLPSGTD